MSLACVHGKVARPIADVKFAAARGGDFHLNFSEGCIAAPFFRREPQSVLFAKIARNERGYARDGFGGAREVGDAAGAFAEPAKGARVFFLAVTLQDDRINQHLRALSEVENLRILYMAGVIAAVTHDDQGFFLGMAKTQMLEPFRDRVIQGGSPASGNGSDGSLEIFGVVCERFSSEHLEPHIVVEVVGSPGTELEFAL